MTSPSRTSFGAFPEHLRPILDEFLEAMRIAMDAPSYFPGPGDKSRWRKGAHDLYENFRGYRPGFLLWAVPQHICNFPECRYIASPWTLRYLWDQYLIHEKRTRELSEHFADYRMVDEKTGEIIESEAYICPRCEREVYNMEGDICIDCAMLERANARVSN